MDEGLVNTLMDIHSKVSVVADKIPGIESSIVDIRAMTISASASARSDLKIEIEKIQKEMSEKDKAYSDRIKVLETRQVQYGTIIALIAFIASLWGKDIINFLRTTGG
jgi:virulence-associated protein VapD